MLDDHTQVISPPRSRLILLDRHHLNFDSGNCYICDLPSPLPAGDHNATSFRSEARLFENDIELGPRNTQHADIRRLGRGRFSHWMHQLYFSSSDNSSPIENGRTYHLLIPPSMFAADNTTYVPSLEGIEFGKMALMERFALARNVYRKVWGNTPLPDHGRRIDTDQNFAREVARLYAEDDFTYERKYNLDQLFQLVLNIGGDVAECGVYKGGSTFFLARHIAERGLNKRLCLFDSFEGLSAPTKLDGGYWRQGALASTVDDVQRALDPLGPLQCVEFFRGWIPDRFTEVSDRHFCFVHIDVDLYQPTLDSIIFFYPRLEPGGIIVLDDYGFESCPGVTAAIDWFMKDKAEPIINLSAGGAFIVKKS